MAKDKGKGPGEGEFEEMEWDEEAADEALFGDDDEDDEDLDDLKISGDQAEEDSSEESSDEEEVAEQTVADEAHGDDEAMEAAPAALAKEKSRPVGFKEIPVALVIEIGRLQLSAQQLMEMRSGNVLDLRVQPESGVDLVVNNQLVGRGELVQVGGTLAVRVLEVGK